MHLIAIIAIICGSDVVDDHVMKSLDGSDVVAVWWEEGKQGRG